MQAIPLIHSSLLRPFIDWVSTHEEWLHEELWNLRLPAGLADDAEMIIPLAPALEFIHRTARRTGAGALGIEIGSSQSIRSMGHLGNAVRCSPTLLSAINTLAATLHCVTTIRRIWLEVDGDVARICHRAQRYGFVGTDVSEQYALMLLVNLVREAAGKDWWPDHVALSEPVFGINPLAGRCRLSVCDHAFIEFDAALLPVSLYRSQPGTGSGGGVAQSGLPTDLVGSLLAAVDAHLHAGIPSLANMAHMLDVSPRTLQRRLASEGMTYDRLLGAARFRLATRLLADRKLRITDIAYALNYNDAANFTRAFRRWTNRSPAAFRTELAESAAGPQ